MSNKISDDQIEIMLEFVQESRDMIEQLEPTIIELGQSCQDASGDPETINAVFRLFHSMKGSAGFLDLIHMSGVAHAAENLLDLIRSDKIGMTENHVDLLCHSCDFAKDALDLVESEYSDQGMEDAAQQITAKLKQSIEEAAEPAAEPETLADCDDEVSAAEPEQDETSLEFAITPEMIERFVQEADELLQSAEQGLLKWADNLSDAEVIAPLFRDIHSFKGNCGFYGFSDPQRLSHLMETVLDLAKSGADLARLSPSEPLLACLDELRTALSDIAEGGKGNIVDIDTHLGILEALLAEVQSSEPAAPADPPPAEPSKAPTAPSKASQPAPQAKPAAAAAVPATKPAPQGIAKAAVKRQDLRVDLDKLDQLINLIGEMVIAENMLIHNPDIAGLELENFHKAGQQMSKLVRELQEIAMTIRMIPVSGLFRRMIRLVHDLSVKSGKLVELKLSGDETEVDKTVIETITDPLVHLIRNSLDHGLEPPEERVKAGKPEKGTVQLSARHEEGEVWITIEDDGRGLNRDKILAKAMSKGLIEGDGSELSEKQIFNLIFHAGFSTADKVTDVSGRGVGMDVVRQNIEKIKGKIEVYSKEGEGTRLVLRIPLTLGIIDGMMVRVGDTKCIVPTLAIKEAFRPTEEAITTTPDGQELAKVRENFFPVTRLHSVLQKTPDSLELSEGILILLEYQDKGICLFVDEIVGQQQTVIKGLSDYIGNVRWVSGCTILGDGEVCLILDVGHLVDMYDLKEAISA